MHNEDNRISFTALQATLKTKIAICRHCITSRRSKEKKIKMFMSAVVAPMQSFANAVQLLNRPHFSLRIPFIIILNIYTRASDVKILCRAHEFSDIIVNFRRNLGTISLRYTFAFAIVACRRWHRRT